jgi:hypothetical protein
MHNRTQEIDRVRHPANDRRIEVSSKMAKRDAAERFARSLATGHSTTEARRPRNANRRKETQCGAAKCNVAGVWRLARTAA